MNVEHSEVQTVSNDQGDVSGVFVPIDLWREISSELETQYLLSSETMRRRLMRSLHRGPDHQTIPLDEVIERLGLDEND